jgi:hypothetical protein
VGPMKGKALSGDLRCNNSGVFDHDQNCASNRHKVFAGLRDRRQEAASLSQERLNSLLIENCFQF